VVGLFLEGKAARTETARWLPIVIESAGIVNALSTPASSRLKHFVTP